MRKPFPLPAREEGQTMAEYATVLAVITIACVTAFALLTASATDVYLRIADLFK